MLARVFDTVRFIGKLNRKKLWNITLLYLSFQLSRLARKAIQWGIPMTISIEPTTACNLRCPECPSGLRAFSRPTGNLKTDFFRQTIDQLSDKLAYLIFYFQGEPFINPDFLKMVEYAHTKRIYTISSTNGHFLDRETAYRTVKSGLDRLIISVDGTTQEVYEQYRKEGSLSRVIEGTRELIAAKRTLGSRTPYIIFQFLVVGPNEHQIPEIKELAKSLGVDELKFKTAQVYDYENGHPLIPKQEKYSRYKQLQNGKFSLKRSIRNECWKLWHAAVITWDGNVVPCCFDKDAKHEMGDLKEKTFQSIWSSQHYQEFREQLLQGRNTIDICSNCSEGCTVWA